jgi:hypothetical protein
MTDLRCATSDIKERARQIELSEDLGQELRSHLFEVMGDLSPFAVGDSL